MPNTRKRPAKDEKSESETLASSPGDNPVELTPKDVPPESATARDQTQRHIASQDTEEREEALLDDAIEDSFPASDPIALPSYAETIGRRKSHKDKAVSAPRQPKSKA